MSTVEAKVVVKLEADGETSHDGSVDLGDEERSGDTPF
jgi:hypothetical protein